MKDVHRSVEVQVLLFQIFITLLLTSQVFAKPVDKAKAEKAVRTFLEVEQLLENKKAKEVAKEGKGILQSIQKYKSENTTPIYGENNEILAWVTEFEPEGYVVTSADDRINPIIAYSFKGKFPFETSKKNILLYLVKWDMKVRQKALNEKPEQLKSLAIQNNEKWADYLSDGMTAMENMMLVEASTAQTQWPDTSYGSEGWIRTEWDQGYYTDSNNHFQQSHYNDKCPQVPDRPGYRCQVGCVATALSQIINYWKFPSSVYFTNDDGYISKGDIGKIHFFEDAGDKGFPSLDELNTHLSILDYDGDPNEEAYLCFGAGVKLQMDYGFYESGTPTAKASNAFLNGFFYGSAKRDTCPMLWTRRKNRVIENIKKGWPCQAGISCNLFWNFHSIIIDGYRDDGYFHINLGWHGTANTWYDLPDIDTRLYDGDYKFNLIHTLVYDISSYQGWSQYGADERNSFYTIYTAPTAENDPLISKWQVTSPLAHKFSGLVVGTSNKIYASMSPENENQGDHPGVRIFNQYGEPQETYYITNEDCGASYPVQNSNGDVFVAGGEGGVYKIDTRAKTVIKTYQDISGSQLKTPKIDSAGCIYVNTEDRLYCLNSDGSWKWTFTPPHSGKMQRGKPSIDVSRNNVYIGYYDAANTTSYLGCINKLNGTLRYEKSFSGITTSSRMTGVASIASDGTVYVGCYNTLYALTPGSGSFSQKWIRSTNSKIADAPVIGEDGTIYIAYWYNSGSSWYYRFNALNPSNGNDKWLSPIDLPSPGALDSVLQPYATANNVVIFSILREQSGPDTFEMYAYRDNGTSATQLWYEDWGINTGGDVAFGPGGTLYVLPSAGGNTIYAVSDGERGDPDGGGMDYCNNVRPNLPNSPSPIDDTNDVNSTVVLSWSCSDPENQSIKYSIFVGESGYDMAPVATNLTYRSYQLTDLEPLTTYRWMIVATDGQAVSDGPTWIFTTGMNPDINKSGKTDFQDYAILSNHWMATDCNEINGWCEKADINKSGDVGIGDLVVMAQHWLENTSGMNNPIIHFPFDNDNNDIAGSHIGYWTGGDFVEGLINQSYHFIGSSNLFADGTEDYFIVSNVSEFAQLTELTISVCFKGRKLHPHGETIVSIGDADKCIGIWVYDDSLHCFAGISHNGISEKTDYIDGYVDNINTWHHYVMTVGDGTLRFYIDGNLVSETNSAGVPNLASTPFYINKHFWYDNGNIVSSSRLQGDIDDVRIYNRVLSQSEIMNLYIH